MRSFPSVAAALVLTVLMALVPPSPAGAGESLACGFDSSASISFTSESFPAMTVGLSGEVIYSSVAVESAPRPVDSARSTVVGHGPGPFSIADATINTMAVAPDGALWMTSGRVGPSNTVLRPAVFRRTADGRLTQIASIGLPAIIGFGDDGRALIVSGFSVAFWVSSSGVAEELPEPPATPTTRRNVFHGLDYQFIRDAVSNRQWIYQNDSLTEVTSLDPVVTVGRNLAQLRDDHVALYSGTALIRRFDVAGIDALTEVSDEGWIAQQSLSGEAKYLFLDRATGEIIDLGDGPGQFRIASRSLDSSWVMTTTDEGQYSVSRLIPPAEAPQRPRAGELEDQVARLYEAYLLRAPDEAGLRFWLDRRASGESITDISNAFAQSPEFVDRYGQLSDADFVDLVYQNVLGRAPDAAGAASWRQQLGLGLSRGAMMIGFSDSPELVARTATTSPSDSIDSQIYRLYRAYLLREPDAAGQCFWSLRLRNGESLAAISEAFAQSPEFIDRYGSLDNGAFVGLIYDNVLDREPDEAGLAFWTAELDNRSRGSLMIGFSESPEYRTLTGTLP